MARIGKVIPGDWVSVERAINRLNQLVNQSLAQSSSPTFDGLKLDNKNGLLEATDGIVSDNGAVYDSAYKACILKGK